MGHRSLPTRSPLTRHARGGGVALCLALGAVPALAETAPATVAVSVDNAKVIRLPERTQTVIVGNPLVADVALQRNGIVILTGKSFGSTNLIALDASGTMLAESIVSVQAAQGSIVTVQRGLDRESYSCTPNCMPSMQLGDATKYFGDVSGQADTRRNLATGGGGGGGGGPK
ncbi:pilus assembly protein N-terminal domain-containing protein [Methylobacterium sp. CM6244]